ncbi:MAG: hypothetical protein ABR591_10835 [Candidatus Velthaea sp.]
MTETVVTLVYAATAYLEPAGTGTAPDLPAAELAVDVAAAAFERIAPRLRPEERSALTAMLTDVRMTVVRKRG